MITLREIKTEDWYISLNKLLGKEIQDIYCHISQEFDSPIIALSKIIFTDGSSMGVDGEHDIAYVYSDNQPNIDEDTLQRLYEEQEDEF